MDFGKLIDCVHDTACVLSVEKRPDGEYGEVRIVAANARFVVVAENPPFLLKRIYRGPGSSRGNFMTNIFPRLRTLSRNAIRPRF